MKKIIVTIILLQIIHSHQIAADLKRQTLVKIPWEIMCFILITVLLGNRCLNRDQLLRKIKKGKKALAVLKIDKKETKAANKKDQQGLTVIILSSLKWMDSRVCTT